MQLHICPSCPANFFLKEYVIDGLVRWHNLVKCRLVEEENVGSIVCLQQDSDMEYFAVDVQPILARAHERGDVRHIRYRINDFDAFDLRMKLPGAAAAVAKEVAQGRKVYIHCTAGEDQIQALAKADAAVHQSASSKHFQDHARQGR